MVLDEVFSRFVKESPVSVIVCGVMEFILSPRRLDGIFGRTARIQYERELLFSTVVDLLSHVVCGIRPSVRAAYQASQEEIAVSLTALYDKLNGVEPAVSRALVRQTAAELAEVVLFLDGERAPLLPGYRTKILDGTALASTEHRLRETRGSTAAPLPGKALVVLEPELGLVTDVFCCEDGHAQERSLLGPVLATVEAGDLWVADRNFCTAGFLTSLQQQGAAFVIRRHAKLACEEIGVPQPRGRIPAGQLFEQTVVLRGTDRAEIRLRQITLRLKQPTREGEREIRILTNLSAEEADAATVAEIYRKRWGIEGAFHELSQTLEAEIDTLSYPGAALLGFCVGLLSYNVFATLKAALRSVHGEEVVEEQVSMYSLTDEIAGTYRGMRIAIPEAEWKGFQNLSARELADLLREVAGAIKLSRYRKSRRGPKKPSPPRQHDPQKPHVSTARLLAQRKPKR